LIGWGFVVPLLVGCPYASFLLALRNIAEANGGMKAVAEKAHLNRESLYRTLSRRGNPEIRTLFNLLHGVGLRLNVMPEEVAA
jgi:probable addiction module antidote protein